MLWGSAAACLLGTSGTCTRFALGGWAIPRCPGMPSGHVQEGALDLGDAVAPDNEPSFFGAAQLGCIDLPPRDRAYLLKEVGPNVCEVVVAEEAERPNGGR